MENGGSRAGISRRKVLAGASLGAIGVVAGASALVDGSTPAYTKYTYAQTQEDREALRVAWYETYNGTPLETQEGTPTANVSDTLDPDVLPYFVDDAPGPVIQIGNVLPGDSGSLHIGLQAVADDPVTVSMTGSLDANDENGFSEPESAAGDTSPNVGELASNVETTIWDDTGVALGGFGACDGTHQRIIDGAIEEPVIESGTLETVLGNLTDRTIVECLGTNADTYCIGFDWELPEGTTNEVQSDGATFTIAFVPTLCEEV